MSLKDMISEADYAADRGVSLRTIQRERALRSCPPYIKLGGKVFYRKAAIDAWLLEQEITPPAKKSA